MAGCCTACKGSGVSGDIETNGKCWDCYGTGHPHPPTFECWILEVKQRKDAWDSATEELGPSWDETEVLMDDLDMALSALEAALVSIEAFEDLAKSGNVIGDGAIWIETTVSQIRNRINSALDVEDDL